MLLSLISVCIQLYILVPLRVFVRIEHIFGKVVYERYMRLAFVSKFKLHVFIVRGGNLKIRVLSKVIAKIYTFFTEQCLMLINIYMHNSFFNFSLAMYNAMPWYWLQKNETCCMFCFCLYIDWTYLSIKALFVFCWLIIWNRIMKWHICSIKLMALYLLQCMFWHISLLILFATET